jgi:putative molybdopterin biosynthesis protein
VLLDYFLTDQGLDPSLISGYDNCTVSHFDAANQVKVGNVDAAMGIHAASYAMDLDFIPLTEEPFELVIPRNNIDHPAISALMESITNKEWKQRVTAMGGYRWAT